MNDSSGNGRKQFDAIDMLTQARGLPTPEGYAIITRQFADFLIRELGRLYDIEDEHNARLVYAGPGITVTGGNAVVEILKGVKNAQTNL